MKNDSRFPKRFPVFHVPHDGTVFPSELMRSVCVSKEVFLACHEKMRDVGALEMVPENYRNAAHTVYFPISRLLCDVERFLGPEETMERLGMGFCYERAFDGTRIKQVTEELKQDTLRYYREHHARLDSLCAGHLRVLLLDLHSFSEEIVPREQLRPGEGTPDICLGVDERFKPEEFVASAESILRSAGFTTARNYPYSGSLVPNAVLTGKLDCDCASIMLEWNRRMYCDASGTPRTEALEKIRSLVSRIAASNEWL